MRCAWLVIPGVVFGCAAGGMPDPVVPDPEEQVGTLGVPDVQCAGTPNAGPTRKLRHFKSRVIVNLGSPKHRGLDLVTSADRETQQLEGWISYGLIDKALEDEDVDVFACRASSWQRIGGARTDDEGHFTLRLDDAARLPTGLRDLFVSVAGDRTGTRFLAYVAPEGTPLIVSDVDGTLTSSESAFWETILLGIEPGARSGAATALAGVTARGYQPIYVTARGNQYTTATRDWLAHRGFPRGPVRLAESFVTLPGDDTVEYKTRTIQALANSGVELAAGIGNRASDVAAYANSGIAADRIFVELPDYASELAPLLDSGAAIGFTSYAQLAADELSKLP